MYSYKCIVSYDGTRYNGWQKQGNTPNTIQEKIEDIFTKTLNEPIEITGSGRTDAGVHALGQPLGLTVPGPKQRRLNLS